MDEARHIYERRRLRRRLGLWRVAAVVAVALAAGAWFWRDAALGPYVARYTVAGVIFDDPARDAMFREIAEDEDVEALILRIDSPGGTVPGSEALYQAVRTVAARKPVAAVMGEVAASGGYIAALSADRIIARGGTITGSIGVLAEYPNVEELLDMVGVDVRKIASGPLKAEPSPFHEPDPEAIAYAETLIADSYEWFVGLVADRRALGIERARALGDGRVFTGRMALEEGLIDAIGGEAEARAWLTEMRGVPSDAPVRDVEPNREDDGLLGLVAGGGVDFLARIERWRAGPRLMAILP